MTTETQLDLLPDHSPGYCEDYDSCKKAICGCAWLETGSPFRRDQSIDDDDFIIPTNGDR